MSYVPPHKRKEAPVQLKTSDFPSLSGNEIPKAGAGGPSYISKINTSIVTPSETVKIQRISTVQVPQTIAVKEKVTVIEKTPHDEGEWVTKESKSSKKTKSDSDWDDFDGY
jgi:hypothetical protein